MSNRGLVVSNSREAWRAAVALHAGGMIPKSYKTVEQVYTAILMGAEIGLPPAAALRCIAVINGTPSIWGSGGYALPMTNDLYERHEVTWQNNGEDETDLEPEMPLEREKWDGYFRCIVRVWRKGNPKPFIAKFSVNDAKRAKIWDKTTRDGEPMTWSLYPARMMYHKAMGNALEAACPEAYMGITPAGAEELVRPGLEDPKTAPYPTAPTTLHRGEEPQDASFTITPGAAQAVVTPSAPAASAPPAEPEKVRKRKRTKEEAPPPVEEPLDVLPLTSSTESEQEQPEDEEPKQEQAPVNPKVKPADDERPTNKSVMQEFAKSRPEHKETRMTNKNNQNYVRCGCGAMFKVEMVGSVVTFPEVEKGDGSCKVEQEPEPVEEKPKKAAEPEGIDPKLPPIAPKNGMSQSGQAYLKDLWETTSKSEVGEMWSLLVRRLNSSTKDDAKAEAQFLCENCIRRRLELGSTITDITAVSGWVNEVKARMPEQRIEVLRKLFKVLQSK